MWASIQHDVLGAVARVGASGSYVLGAEVSAFESELAATWGIGSVVGCGNGLDALEIALRSLGVRPGDAVLTTPLTAFATTLAILRVSAVPCFVDVDESGLLDLAAVERALDTNADIRWMLPVHLYGHSIDLARLAALRDRFELTIVEDCAQAIGARSGDVPVGSVGRMAATSFYPTKNLGCMGDGGAVATSVAELATRARCLRDYGQSAKYEHSELGLNSRLDELQAGILRSALLPRLATYTERRRQVAARYRREIRNSRLSLPPVPEGSRSVWHLFPVLVAGDASTFGDHLTARGVACARHYPRFVPDQGALRSYANYRVLGPLDNALRFARHEVSIPIHPLLLLRRAGDEGDRGVQ